MPGAFTVTFTEDDLQGRQSYDEFEAGWYLGTLVDIKEVKATKTANTGKRWVFQVDGLNFSITTWDKGGGGWKLAEVLRGLGMDVTPGQPVSVNPARLLGTDANVYIDREDSESKFMNVVRVRPADIEMPADFLDLSV